MFKGDQPFVLPPVWTASLAVFCGTCLDALIRYTRDMVDLPTLVFARFAIATILVGVPFFLSGRRLGGWEAARFHALRGLVHLIAASLFFFALTKLHLALVTVLGFTSVLWITPMAWLLLNERPRAIAGVAGLIGFCGVAVTFIGRELQGSLGVDEIQGFISVICSAVFYGLALVLLRKRATKDGTFLIAFYANLFPAIYTFIPFLVLGQGVTLEVLPFLVVMGILGTTIWVLMTSAYARAPAQLLAPTEYTALVWSVLIGWWLFKEVPEGLFWPGAGLVLLSCALVSFASGKKQKAKPTVTNLTD